MKSSKKIILFFGIFFIGISCHTALGATFTGTNAPGEYTDFSFVILPADSGLRLSLPRDGDIASYILLKFGSALADNDDYDFSSKLDDADNLLYLEAPELQDGTWYVRVYTPPDASGNHSFSLEQTVGTFTDPITKTMDFNIDGVSLNSSGNKYYRVEIPDTHEGWRIVLASTVSSDIFLRTGSTSGSSIKQSYNNTLHTLLVAPEDLTSGAVYYIQVHADADLTFDLFGDPVYIRDLTWDPGTDPDGTELMPQPDTEGGDYYFRIVTQTSDAGAWRHALKVTAGEADLYCQQGSVVTGNGSYNSANVGSDGFILDAAQFSESQTWYYRVHATPGSEWLFYSGDIYAYDLGDLPADGSSTDASAIIGPEGMYFFKTNVGENIDAWRIWLEGDLLPIYVNQNTAPVDTSTSYYDKHEDGQMLLVPTYLTSALYFVGVSGDPGTAFDIDSRKQQIRTPSSEPGYSGTDEFDFTLTGSDDSGYGYITYQVTVPVDQIAWQVKCESTSGDAHIYVRQGDVPNRFNNDGLSEAVGTSIVDSITHVPPTLTDGTWYITVYGIGSFSYVLTSQNPVVTGIAFLNDPTPVENGAAFESQSGWRYFQVSDIESQLGYLGWELELQNQIGGTEIAVRRNAVPSRWDYRQNGYTTVYSASHVDDTSTTGLLQRPEHEADIWYVGIYLPNESLGDFDLYTRAIPAPEIAFNGGSSDVTLQPEDSWKYFMITVPDDAIGWDIRLTNVTSGVPRMVIRRDELAGDFTSTTHIYRHNYWNSGEQWAAGNDWTGRYQSASGDERYRLLAMGMGAPLEPGTYYVGISNNGASASMSYTLHSRGIGIGNDGFGSPWAIQVADLSFSGGSDSATGLSPREAAYYRVAVPADTESWSLQMTPTSPGEAMIAIRYGTLPNVMASWSYDTDGTQYAGAERQRDGQEFFYKYHNNDGDPITSGYYYVAVVSEGQSPANYYTIGTGTVGYTITSHGEQTINDKTASPLAVGTPVEWIGESLDYGQQKVYRFRVPAGLLSMEVRLKNRVGDPTMALHQGTVDDGRLPYVSTGDDYDAEEGGATPIDQNLEIITLAEPDEGDYTLTVAAGKDGTSEADASYDVEISAQGEIDVDFNGGSAVITDQEEYTWRYFKIVVPDDANLLGWDIRLTNVTSGIPRMVIRRDDLPADFNSTSYIYRHNYWNSGEQWAAGDDWTARYNSTTGENVRYRILAMGIGSPLEPGTYHVGVSNYSASDPMSYTLLSRGIGIGNDAYDSPWAIQVADLSFSGGSDSATGLSPREAAYYRVAVPADTESWSLQMAPDAPGEAMLAVRYNALPNVSASWSYDTDSNTRYAGTERQKSGQEFFYKYHNTDGDPITAGYYYVAVISEGQDPLNVNTIGTGTVDYTITSHGEMPIDDKTSSVLAVDTPVEWTGESLDYGQQKVYRFRVPEGILSMEVRLKNRTGDPTMALHQGAVSAGRIPYVSTGDDYNAEENGATPIDYAYELIPLSEPAAGDYTLTVAAGKDGTSEADATYDVEVTAYGETEIDFNGGSAAVVNQGEDTWRYFQVVVPDDASLLGWDIRLTNVTSGIPRMVVCRDDLPANFNSTSYINRHNYWNSGEQWAAGDDWTARYNSAAGENVRYRILAMGIGSPLEPGTYHVGVSNYSASDPMSYTLLSRGIGIGNDAYDSPWAIQVADLSFSGGSDSATGLSPREAAYYRVSIPAETESWSLQMTPDIGEALIAVRHEALPNVTASASTSYPSDSTYRYYGRKCQKSGQEFFYKYQNDAGDPISAGYYYIAVASEGRDPINDNTIGTGDVNFTLTSHGEMPIDDKTTTPLAVGSPLEWTGQAIDYGQQKVYRFRVPDGLTSMQVLLDNRVGDPVMSIHRGENYLGIIPTVDYAGSGHSDDYDAEEDGATPIDANYEVITVPYPEGDYTVTVAAGLDGSEEVNAEYDLIVSAIVPDTDLAFDGGSHTTTLINQQVYYYRVEVPETVDGDPVAGWKLYILEDTGTASLRLRKDQIPDTTATATLSSSDATTIVSPPFLTPGIWFVEVKASGLTQYSIFSHALRPERSWDMPAEDGQFTQPGMDPPFFGDSGIDEAGDPIINPDTEDQGTDLEEGDYHFYRITVPDNNTGFLRTVVEALSGDPDLYIRVGNPPTLNHEEDGTAGYLYDRFHTGSGTMYATWVPLDGRFEYQLPTGDWWLAVRAIGSNVRYRLKVSTGDVRDGGGNLLDTIQYVQDLDMDGGSKTAQLLAAGDMRYYKVEVPALPLTPDEWTLNLQQIMGDVVVFIRDTIPPGQGSRWYDGSYTSYFQDWYDDHYSLSPNPYVYLDDTGDHVLTVPPVSPGAAYYLGVFAKNDATFSLTSSVSGSTIPFAGEIEFYGGSVTETLASGETLLYQINTPADATRWRHEAVHIADVKFYISQGTIPPQTTSAHWYSTGANSTFSKYLYQSDYLDNYPWQPLRSYYLLVANTSGSAQEFTFTMDGRNQDTDDEDEDGILDWWEWNYFGTLSYTPTHDYDGDGVNNGTEYADGTDPSDPTDALITLIIESSPDGDTDMTPDTYRLPWGTVIHVNFTPYVVLNPNEEVRWLLGNGQKGLLGESISFDLIVHTTLEAAVVDMGTHLKLRTRSNADVFLSGSEVSSDSIEDTAVVGYGSFVVDDFTGTDPLACGFAFDNYFVYENGAYKLGTYTVNNAIKWVNGEAGDFSPDRVVSLPIRRGYYDELHILNTGYSSGSFVVTLNYETGDDDIVTFPARYWYSSSSGINLRYNRDGATSPTSGFMRYNSGSTATDVGLFSAAVTIDNSRVLEGASLTTQSISGTVLVLGARLYGEPLPPRALPFLPMLLE